MHSFIEALNMESYSKAVWDLSTYKTTAQTTGRTWIKSCTAHTMKRFVDAIKKVCGDKHLTCFFAYCFSLMLNSIDLKTISYYFEIISYIIQSEYENDTLEAKILNIREAINNRQEAKEKIEKMVYDNSIINENKDIENGKKN
jgi:hypothetical protein